ncbi:hypothetical protein GAH_01591 [Geoglobus ahangari]|uniref:DUF86 domain-containing protein n=1 Tax=Geoglobus ahangari TaxID=113653 RepID=A0A0F7DBH9_9EURY|nr:DUF86 domain-containing protein [Geoglobus ahangari]AKG91121.1 hypothetical protein GAH_01591 [Geoglobus ahangari]
MRRKRYLEKLEWIEEEVNFTAGMDLNGNVERRAVLYSILTAVEAAMDIVAMLLKDLGFEVEDDYSNIKKLVDEGVLSEEDADLLRRFNGLRNAIAHHYNHLDLKKVEGAIESMGELLDIAARLVEVAEKLVK